MRGLAGGSDYRLQLRRRGFALARNQRSAAVDASPGEKGISLVYAAPAGITFQVVDAANGRPLTEFEVQAGSGWLAPQFENGEIKEHWPEGRVRLEDLQESAGLAADGRVRVQVHATGYESFERTDIAYTGDEEVDLGVIRLKPVPVVRIEVLDSASGEPVKGAEVALIPEGEERDPSGLRMNVRIAPGPGEEPQVYLEGSNRRTGVTDEHGVCILTSLPGEAAVIRVRSEEHAPYASEPIALPANDDLDHRVTLVEGSTALVLVTDSEGNPLPGLRVEHERPSGIPWSPEALSAGGERPRVSDSEGRILFARLEEGVHRFRLVEDPFEERVELRRLDRYGERAEEEGWRELLVAPGGEESLTLVAAPRGDLEGTITEAGLALSGAAVRLLPLEDPEDGSTPSGPTTRTDSKGRYLLEGVKTGDYRLEIAHATRVMPWEEKISLRAGRNEEDLDLPVTIIEGRVKDALGEPVAGARVGVERARGDEAGGRRRVRMLRVTMDDSGGTTVAMSGTAAPVVETDEKGNYRLRGVRDDWPLQVKVTGEDFAPAHSERLELEAAEIRRDVDLVVKPAGSIAIAVKRPDGSAASGFLLRGSYLGEAEEELEPVVGFLDGEGRARLSGCLVGRWRVSFDPFTLPGQEALEPPEPREVEVEAGETASIEVTVGS